MQSAQARAEVTGQAKAERATRTQSPQLRGQAGRLHQVVEERGVRVHQATRSLDQLEEELDVAQTRVQQALLGRVGVRVPEHHALVRVSDHSSLQLLHGEAGLGCQFDLATVDFLDRQEALRTTHVGVSAVGCAVRVLLADDDPLLRWEVLDPDADMGDDLFRTRHGESTVLEERADHVDHECVVIGSDLDECHHTPPWFLGLSEG